MVVFQHETQGGTIWGMTSAGVRVFEGADYVEKVLEEFGGTHTQKDWKRNTRDKWPLLPPCPPADFPDHTTLLVMSLLILTARDFSQSFPVHIHKYY